MCVLDVCDVECIVDGLICLFNDCEDLGAQGDLYTLNAIMKSIVFLNEAKIFEHMVEDTVFSSILGILERTSHSLHLD